MVISSCESSNLYTSIWYNGNSPTYSFIIVNVGDVIEVRERSLNLAVIKEALENKVATPAFVEVDTNKLTGKLTRVPETSELNSEINESLIVEYYNRLG